MYLCGYFFWHSSVGLKLSAVIIFGIRFGMFSWMYFGYSWKSSITIRGHSVRTLKDSLDIRDSGGGEEAASGSVSASELPVFTTVGLSSVVTLPNCFIIEVERLA